MNENKEGKTRMSRLSMSLWVLFSLLAVGCKPEPKPDVPPVAQYLKDNEDCTCASAEAILKSGLPYPNSQFETYVDEKGRQKQRLVSRDMWLGPDRFVIPGEVVGSNPTWPEYHPRHYQRLGGSLPNFYPPGPSEGVIDGMVAMVDVHFTCSMEPSYAATWGKGYRSNEEGIEKVRVAYQREATLLPKHPGLVTLSKREDLGMWELLLDFQTGGKGGRSWEASYWPIDRELKGPDGPVSSIKCDRRHDPEEKRYSGIGWICSSGMRLTEHASVRVDVYVSHLTHMPSVFDQVQQLLVNVKQPRE